MWDYRIIATKAISRALAVTVVRTKGEQMTVCPFISVAQILARVGPTVGVACEIFSSPVLRNVF